MTETNTENVLKSFDTRPETHSLRAMNTTKIQAPPRTWPAWQRGERAVPRRQPRRRPATRAAERAPRTRTRA